jgi:hypothetical protein
MTNRLREPAGRATRLPEVPAISDRAGFCGTVAVEQDDDTGDCQPETQPIRLVISSRATQTLSSAAIGWRRCSMSLMCPGEKKTCAIALG